MDEEECEEKANVGDEDEQASEEEKDVDVDEDEEEDYKIIAIQTNVGFIWIGMRLREQKYLSKVIFVTSTKTC